MRKYIGAFGNWHVYAFAHFGYQIQAISILSSIFMTVVLALERYLAITKPIEYHNAIQERRETTEFKTSCNKSFEADDLVAGRRK